MRVQGAAVMGPSGAGKTTFLNALMGTVKYGTISGQVWVNGRAMKMSRLRRIMGFVPQVRACPCWYVQNQVLFADACVKLIMQILLPTCAIKLLAHFHWTQESIM